MHTNNNDDDDDDNNNNIIIIIMIIMIIIMIIIKKTLKLISFLINDESYWETLSNLFYENKVFTVFN